MTTDILGIRVDEIPQTWTPVGVVALIECLDDDGDQRFLIRHAGMSRLARVGALTILHAQELGDWATVFEPTGDDE